MSEVTLVLTSMSAADFYRRRFPAFTAPSSFVDELSRPCAYKEEDVWSLAPFWVDPSFVAPEAGALHVLTRTAAQRGNARNVRAHVWSNDFPSQAFIRYNENVVVSSPGFTFLQLAAELSFQQIIAYGNELCGLYSLDDTSPQGYRERKVPLITLDELNAFVEKCVGMRGYRRAIQALPHVIGNSPDPDSTMVEMFGCLSFHHGGYALKTPDMGATVPLNKRGSLIAGCDSVRVGVCWPEDSVCFMRVDLPAGSDPEETKLSPARKPALALGGTGYTVIELANGEIRDRDAFEKRTLQAAAALGKRVPRAKMGNTPQRQALREAVFEWHDLGGHTR